jgi:hypothetical protein
MKMTIKRKPSELGPVTFVTEYIHYRTRKVMKAQDYGYKAWPLGGSRKKR